MFKTSDIVIFMCALVFASLMFGVVLPAMISAHNTIMVVGGLTIVFVCVIVLAVLVNNFFNKRRKDD